MTQDSLATILRKGQHRVTPQRLLVLSSLRDAGGHATVADLIDRARIGYPDIDSSTVYRILALAEDMGLVARFERSGHETEFEWLDHMHHHLICQSCGGMETLSAETATLIASLLFDASGFTADLRHLAIGGICRRCRAQP